MSALAPREMPRPHARSRTATGRRARILRAAACALACAAWLGCQGSAARPVEGWDVYGADLQDRPPLALAELLADPAAHDGATVALQETISEVCQMKGCWMTFGSGDAVVRVSFKDYAFFVPKDGAGRVARVEGVFRVREVPLEEARHYLEDAGKHEQAAALSGPQRAYELEATGVRLKQAELATGSG